jgi:hypothetical protein
MVSQTKRLPLHIGHAASVVCVDAATPNWETWASVRGVGTMKKTYQKPTLFRRDMLPKLVASMQVWSDVQLVSEVEAED